MWFQVMRITQWLVTAVTAQRLVDVDGESFVFLIIVPDMSIVLTKLFSKTIPMHKMQLGRAVESAPVCQCDRFGTTDTRHQDFNVFSDSQMQAVNFSCNHLIDVKRIVSFNDVLRLMCNMQQQDIRIDQDITL